MIHKVRYGNTSKLVFQKGIMFGDELIVRWLKNEPIVEGLESGIRMTNKYTATVQRITYLTKEQ